MTVPHAAVDVGYVIAAELEVLAGAEPDAEFQDAAAMDTRAYDPPETSVNPVPASVPTAVNQCEINRCSNCKR